MTTVGRDDWEERFAAGRGFRGIDAHELRLFRQAVRPRPGTRVLDVGCGLGGYPAALAGLGCDTLAVDWTDAAVAATRDRYTDLEPRLRVERLDFEDAAEVAARLPRASYDVVTMRLVLAFMADKAAVTETVRGLLAPGGMWVVTTPLAGRLPEERQRIGVTAEDVAVVTDGWVQGHWYDLEPGGVRCFVLRA